MVRYNPGKYINQKRKEIFDSIDKKYINQTDKKIINQIIKKFSISFKQINSDIKQIINIILNKHHKQKLLIKFGKSNRNSNKHNIILYNENEKTVYFIGIRKCSTRKFYKSNPLYSDPYYGH